ncbi:MAG: NADH-quinone oxidoreductase subunit L [Phycisphaeraceae bacterium]|nr:NADH-quinone oxidoreductase subunit L [Phycisphaeraceae bacterium]
MIPLILTATLLPLASSAVAIFFGKRWLGKGTGVMATAAMGVSFACSLAALVMWLGGPRQTIVWNVPWIPVPGTQAGWLYLGILVDSLGVAMVAMVSLISTLVHLYSIGYMRGDSRYERFFAYLSLFTFSMLGIVTANSIAQLFVSWELVGLTSYLLIGFWFEKRGPQLACKKAFVMNRIGDTGFLIGFGILFYKLGGNLFLPAVDGGMFDAIAALIREQGQAAGSTFWTSDAWLTLAGIGLFCGAIGKSAQFPLHTWLPDAMEGPTPVSSIVHSATMVAAGVYLTGRIYPILTPQAHLFVATIGLITLVMAAAMALVMTDIKRVLAYSTLSQLGYMVLGLGVGAYTFALFHLVTHAFFKCCLFQCSGSVIHAAHHQQDMRFYGGLGKKLPITALCFGICTLAIAGASIPYTTIGLSGFYSKDGIIAGAVNYGHAMEILGPWAKAFWLGPIIIAYVTPFYMARAFTLTFLGRPRDHHLHEHAHEAPVTMLVPQLVLATMAVISGWFLWKGLIVASEPPARQTIISAIQTAATIESHDSHGMHATHAMLLSGLAWILSLGVGVLLYLPGMAISSKIVRIPGINLLYTWAHNKFYFDDLYDGFVVSFTKAVAFAVGWIDKTIVDGLVNLVGLTGQGAAWLVGVVDSRVVDGAVDGAAALAQNSGRLLGKTHSGRVRGYVLLMFGSAAIVTLAVLLTILVLR